MRRAIATGALLAVVAFAALLGWRSLRTPVLPRPEPRLADRGVIKSDLIVYARAERAFYASVGHYASMAELRAKGLLSLPPDTRWPYRYMISVPAPNAFVVVAMPQSAQSGRAVMLTIDDQMNMRAIDPHDVPQHHRRRGNLLRTKVA